MNTVLDEKRLLIKTSIKTGNKIPFTPNSEDALYWWGIVNDVVFEGKLKEPECFVFKKFQNAIGWCIPYRFNNKKNRRVRIGIRSSLNNLSDFLCVLIHEMVHQWEWEILGEWNDSTAHGKSFYSWRDAVKDLTGAPLTSTYTIASGKKVSW